MTTAPCLPALRSSSAPAAATALRPHDPVDTLRPLLAAAAELGTDDPAWGPLGERSRAALAELAAAGAIAPHLTLADGESPVVVTRTLVAAWRRVVGSPAPDRGRLDPRPPARRRFIA